MKIRVNDKVKVIAGKDKGTIGTVLKVFSGKAFGGSRGSK